MGQITQYVIQIGIFMICAQVLIHFRPDGSYEKYLKFLVSIMILVQLFSPVLEWIGREWDPKEGLASFEEELERLELEAQEIGDTSELVLDEMTLWQIREQIQGEEAVFADAVPENAVSKEAVPEEMVTEKALSEETGRLLIKEVEPISVTITEP